jgi:hypothetical protein
VFLETRRGGFIKGKGVMLPEFGSIEKILGRFIREKDAIPPPSKENRCRHFNTEMFQDQSSWPSPLA